MSQEIRYLPLPAATGGFSPVRAAGWLALLGTLALLLFGGFLTWRWVDDHILSIGIEDAGTTKISQTELVQRVQSFELVTLKETYDTSSNTDFKKRLNLGLTRIGLPGFVAGQELDVAARVTVAAGVDMSQVRPEDVQVIDQGDSSVVVVRIPQADITSTEIDADSFAISTRSGILTRLRRTVGLSEPDVRDGAVGEVTSLAREEAIKSGILEGATREAQARLQAFLQSLPQPDGRQVTYLVELQPPPER